MKKLFSIACVVVAVMTLSSCTKKYITANNNITVYATVEPTKWVQTRDGKSDSTTVKVNELDNYYNSVGGVLVYFSYGKQGNQPIYEQIPEVYDGISFSYVHNPGYIVLYAQPVGGGAPVKPTSTINAKILLIDSN